jgi:hypothetical protein
MRLFSSQVLLSLLRILNLKFEAFLVLGAWTFGAFYPLAG